MLNRCDIRGYPELGRPCKLIAGTCQLRGKQGKACKSNRLASRGRKSCKLSSIYGKFVVDKFISLLIPAFPTYLQSPTANPLVQRLSAPQQDRASKPVSGKAQIFTQGAAQPRKKIHFRMYNMLIVNYEQKLWEGKNTAVEAAGGGRGSRGRRDVPGHVVTCTFLKRW